MPVTLSVDHVRKTATATAIGPIAIGDVREHLDAERIRSLLDVFRPEKSRRRENRSSTSCSRSNCGMSKMC